MIAVVTMDIASSKLWGKNDNNQPQLTNPVPFGLPQGRL
jgi:hypothetical protein